MEAPPKGEGLALEVDPKANGVGALGAAEVEPKSPPPVGTGEPNVGALALGAAEPKANGLAGAGAEEVEEEGWS